MKGSGHEYRVFAQFITDTINIGSIGAISADDQHHLSKVLRLKPGDSIVAVARGQSLEFDCNIIEHDSGIAVKVFATRLTTAPISKVVSLSCALLKGSHNDLICEHAAELGVRNICFFPSQRSVAKIKEPTDIDKRVLRWTKIAESAARQSGQISIPRIHFCSNLEALISQARTLAAPDDRYFCCALLPDSKEIRDIPVPAAGIHLIVGPEGDFSPEEYGILAQSGFEGITLGPLRLRAETAAISSVCMAQAVWGF